MVTVKVPQSPDYGAEIKDGPKVEVATPNARQGVTGHNVWIVLAVSVTAVVILFALIYFGFFG